MRNPGGATIAQMMARTGWQAHTVRGAISGMVRKRLGYEVVTDKGADGQRVYLAMATDRDRHPAGATTAARGQEATAANAEELTPVSATGPSSPESHAGGASPLMRYRQTAK